jgi:hypothetical protein
MKRTLKRELKVLEIVKREAFGPSIDAWPNHVEQVSKRYQGGAVSGVTWWCNGACKAVLWLCVGQHRLDCVGGRKVGGR